MKLLQVTHVRKFPHYFHVRGYLIHQTCMQFVEEVNKNIVSAGSSITIDLDDLHWIDASGIGVLTTLSICLKHQKRSLIVFTLEGSQPYKILKKLGIIRLIGAKYATLSKNSETSHGHSYISDDIRSTFATMGIDCSYD